MKNKIPRTSSNPYKREGQPKVQGDIPSKVSKPRVADKDPNVNKRLVRFCFDMVDLDGPWSMHLASQDQNRELLERFKQLEKMQCSEAFKPGGMSKSYGDMSECPNSEALKRLEEQYEGLDTIIRFEFTGLQRLYGVRAEHEFHVLWWDPRHEIWPSKKKGT